MLKTPSKIRACTTSPRLQRIETNLFSRETSDFTLVSFVQEHENVALFWKEARGIIVHSHVRISQIHVIEHVTCSTDGATANSFPGSTELAPMMSIAGER